MSALNFKEIASLPGYIIYNEVTTIGRDNQPPKTELVRFILNTSPDENGFLEGKLLDKDWILLSEKKMSFRGIDEFFALIKYLVRNGFNTKNT